MDPTVKDEAEELHQRTTSFSAPSLKSAGEQQDFTLVQFLHSPKLNPSSSDSGANKIRLLKYLGKILVTLEDESGHKFHVKYYADKTGLSAGWRQFCCTHNVLEVDVLVFQLVEPTKLKIYIIRANDLNELDGALGLLNLDAHTKQSDAGKLIGVFVRYHNCYACQKFCIITEFLKNKDDAETGPTASESTKRKRPKSLSFCSKEE